MKSLNLLLILLFFECSWALIPPQEVVSAPKGTIRADRFDVGKIVPLNLPPGASQTVIGTRILDHSVGSYVKEQVAKQDGGVWRAAKKINKLQGEMKIESEPSSPGAPSVTHSFAFQMQALQKMAYFSYRGHFHANLNYNFGEKVLNLEMTKDILQATQLVYNYSQVPQSEFNQVFLRWNWD